MRVPAFQYPGGKAMVRDRVLRLFPERGRTYVEPFAGRGNVFFAARSRLLYSRWVLNDLRTAPFFEALKVVDVRELPERVTREDFERLKADRESVVARVVEPRVTFFGSGYDSAFAGTGGTTPTGYRWIGYTKRCYRPNVLAAQRLLAGVEVFGAPWESLPWGELGESDFAYLDPPYYECADVGYGSIDHEALLDLLSGARFRWVLSGYDSELYRRRLGAPTSFARKANMTMLHAGSRRTLGNVECLWTNRFRA